jgi:hypothetical protein
MSDCDNCGQMVSVVSAIRVGIFRYCEDCAPDGGETETDLGGETRVCPGCDMTDSNGADDWVEHHGLPWHGACVAVAAATKAGLL